MENLDRILAEAEHAITAASDLNALEQVRIQYLGKKGQVTAQLKQLGKLSRTRAARRG